MHSNDCSTKNRCEHIVTQSFPFLILHHSTSLENLRRWLRICTRDWAMHWPKETTAIGIVNCFSFWDCQAPCSQPHPNQGSRGCSKMRSVNPEPRTRRLRWHSSMNAERRPTWVSGDISLPKKHRTENHQGISTCTLTRQCVCHFQEALAMRDAARESLRRQDCAISFCFWILYWEYRLKKHGTYRKTHFVLATISVATQYFNVFFCHLKTKVLFRTVFSTRSEGGEHQAYFARSRTSSSGGCNVSSIQSWR